MANQSNIPARPLRRRILKGLLIGTVALVVSVAAFWVSPWRPRLSPGLKADLRAAFQLRHTPHPARQFLALRYGSLDNPTNRAKAFLGFFDAERIQGMHRIVELTPSAQRQQNVNDMAEWIGEYREGMSAAEKASLANYLRSPEGSQMVQRATSVYLSQGVEYRAATAPVIVQLMTTLDTVKNP